MSNHPQTPEPRRAQITVANGIALGDTVQLLQDVDLMSAQKPFTKVPKGTLCTVYRIAKDSSQSTPALKVDGEKFHFSLKCKLTTITDDWASNTGQVSSTKHFISQKDICNLNGSPVIGPIEDYRVFYKLKQDSEFFYRPTDAPQSKLAKEVLKSGTKVRIISISESFANRAKKLGNNSLNAYVFTYWRTKVPFTAEVTLPHALSEEGNFKAVPASKQ
ncbi:unnamed protein product [Mycena citricolor]|uniref:Uncharacterized protein n=1 Tax=Mycena citricolor TaxID=2018698 RepID=A0AAD2HSB9_9AGAR|nr:unnamed protein product [Mycena citricolor]CAK5280426.1 unnamed protein product [Mycena citricolor]